MSSEVTLEGLLRELAPQALGALLRRHRAFDECEDAVQEALLAASIQWPQEGVPENPLAWLVTVANRRLVDRARSESARRRREDHAASSEPSDRAVAPPPDVVGVTARDDTLDLLVLCCHPALSPASQVALTLRAVGGLTTAEIARAFLVPEATMAQRISRAKAQIRRATIPFGMPPSGDVAGRLPAVLHVLYLIFNEGYTASAGAGLVRTDLTHEAIRLMRTVHGLRPDDPEVTGLLALMVLSDSRRAARTGPDGELVPLAEQDRSSWDRDAIEEGVTLVTEALRQGTIGPYQLQAAIAAVHAEAVSDEETDWPQILALYDLLVRIAPNPIASLNRVVALTMVHGPERALAALDALAGEATISSHHRFLAVRAHLLERVGSDEAEDAYRAAAVATANLAERRYLDARADRLTGGPPRQEET